MKMLIAVPLVALVALPHAQQQTTRDATGAAAAMAAVPPGTATISGAVLTADGGHLPVRRAVITLSGAELPIGRASITDDNGRFSFDRLPAGRFTLSATKPAFLSASYGATRPGRAGVPIGLAAGQRVADLTLLMAHGAAIGGTVRDPKGRPAQGIQVSAYRVLPDGGQAGAPFTSETDDRGMYRIFGLPPGDYIIATSIRFGNSVGETGLMSSAEIDATLAALEHRSSTSAPTAPTAPSAATSTRTHTVNYAPVYYPGALDPTQATKIKVGPGDDRTGTDITMQLARTSTVEGVIGSSMGSIPNLSLTMVQAGIVPPVDLFGGPSLRIRPGVDGRFKFANVNAGRWVIQARTLPPTAPRGSPSPSNSPVLWARTDVEVNGDDVSGVSLTLQPAKHVTGRVVFEGMTAAPPADLTKLRVVLTTAAPRANGEIGLLANTSTNGTLNSDGTFDLPGVVPAAYRLTITPLPVEWSLRSAIANGKDVLDTTLDVSPETSAATEIVVTASDRHSSLSGTIQTPASPSAPASAYFIVVFPGDRSMWLPQARRISTTRAGTDGKFVLRDLPPGDYLIAALTDFEKDDLLDPAFFEKLVPAAVKVTLGEGEQKTQDLRIGG